MRREALGVGTDSAEGTLDDFFCRRAADRDGVAVEIAVRTGEEGSVRCQFRALGLLCEIAFEGATEFRTDRNVAGGAAAALQETGRESDPRADLAVEEDVTDGQRQHLGNPEAEEHLRRNEGAVARLDATDVPNKTPFFPRIERAGARESGGVMRFE